MTPSVISNPGGASGRTISTISFMEYVRFGSAPRRGAMRSGILMAVASKLPWRPPAGGCRHMFVDPNAKVIAISGWSIANFMIPNVSGSLPGHRPPVEVQG